MTIPTLGPDVRVPKDRHSWIDAHGIEHAMVQTAEGLALVQERQGFGAAPRTISERVFPGVPGSQRRSTNVEARDLQLNVKFAGRDQASFRAYIRNWITWLELGVGQIKVTTASGARVIECEYKGGLEGEETNANAGAGWQKAVLAFRAYDPYFKAAGDPVSRRYGVVPGRTPFFPLLPLVINSAPVNQGQLMNVGDVPTYPIWTIEGPGSDVRLLNHTTGESLTWSGTLAAGQLLTIDARQQIGTAILSVPADPTIPAVSAYSRLSQDISFWPLAPGLNDVELLMEDMIGSSGITVTYLPQFRSV